MAQKAATWIADSRRASARPGRGPAPASTSAPTNTAAMDSAASTVTSSPTSDR